MTQERLGALMAEKLKEEKRIGKRKEHRSMAGGHHTLGRNLNSTTTWLTPPQIIAALGPFDLDPCAAPPNRPWNCARRSICLPENGLKADWSNQYVWLNPPYGAPNVISPWLSKMCQHGYSNGSGIALIFARTDTEAFFKYVWSPYFPMTLLFLRSRLHFYDIKGNRAPFNCGAPCVLIAYGEPGIGNLTRVYHDGELEGGLVQRR